MPVVPARCHNGEPRPLNADQVRSLVGQTVRLTRAFDSSSLLGMATVKAATLDGGTLWMLLDLDPRTTGLGEEPIKPVGIGYVPLEGDDTVRLREIAYTPSQAEPMRVIRPAEGHEPADDPTEPVPVLTADFVEDEPPVLAATTVAEGTLTASAPVAPHARKAYDTEEECVAHGGHCFDHNTTFSHATSPPQYPEGCKHCPATRVRISRAPYFYRYPDGHTEEG